MVIQVMEGVCSSLTEVMVETHRRRHLAYLMADHGALINPHLSTNLPKQHLNKYATVPLFVCLCNSYLNVSLPCF